MKKKNLGFWMALLLSFVGVSCSDHEPQEPVEPSQQEAYQDERAYVNFFAYGMLNDIYLWKQDILPELKSWTVFDDPVKAVERVRYKDRAGKEVDRWTMVTDNYTDLVGGVNGKSTDTYGCLYKLYRKEYGSDAVVAFVVYTYPGSPAEKAGLKRGDVLMEIDGKQMDLDNYMDLYYSSSMTVGVGRFFEDGTYSPVEKTVQMQAVAMYEDPVQISKVFDCGGKKVGYLLYTSFTLDSAKDLVDVCREFRKAGITELILDLRYNGGGYVFTEAVLGALLAPAEVVNSGAVFSTEVWNDDYMAYFKENKVDMNTYFSAKFKQTIYNKLYDIDTSDANIGLSKIYALVTGDTASASESLLVCLSPYMDIEVIGSNTHGKYCSGLMRQGAEWYQDMVDAYKDNRKDFAKVNPQFADWERYIADWGIYVMTNTYADKDGNNPCMPDGLVPDVEAYDWIEDFCPLGDERESMLNVALRRAGKTDLEPRAVSRSVSPFPRGEEIRVNRHRLDGKRILTGDLVKSRLVESRLVK